MRNPGGKLSRQDDEVAILRDILRRLKLLEEAVSKIITGVYPTAEGVSIFTRTTPTMSWTITHSKGRFVGAKLYDLTGTEIEVEVTCPDLNTVVLSGLETFAGTAVII